MYHNIEINIIKHYSKKLKNDKKMICYGIDYLFNVKGWAKGTPKLWAIIRELGLS